jgi:RNA polymerase sigma factor (sigma-70 family)
MSIELFGLPIRQRLQFNHANRRRSTFQLVSFGFLSTLITLLTLAIPQTTLSFTPFLPQRQREHRTSISHPARTFSPFSSLSPFSTHCPNGARPLLFLSREARVEERYSVVPPSAVTVNSSTANTLVDGEIRKTIITDEEVLSVHTESKSQLARKRTRVAMKNSPSTRGTAITLTPTKPRRSRSSTMPGFASTSTERQRVFRDGIRLIEERTGRKYIDTPERKKLRRKLNGEAMYKNSASVPDSMVQFAAEIHQEERISRKEEIELGEKTQEAIRLQHLFDSLETRLGREPTDDEWCAAAGKINMAAIGQTIEEGIEAKNKLVTSNLRMVQSVVNTYIRNGLSSQYNAGDLMQEGILALIRAAEKFEPDRGWKFSTYAMYWVRASVKRSQMYQSRIIPVPQRLNENYKRLKRIEKEVIVTTGRRPTQKELGAVVGMSEQQVNRCMDAMSQRCYSLDQEIQNTLKPSPGGDGKDTMIDIVESKSKRNTLNEYDRVDRALLREDLVETLNRYLPPQEAEVLLARFGLIQRPYSAEHGNNDMLPPASEKPITSAGEQQATIAELSRMFNIKPDKLRRMIDQSLKHLQGVGLDEWLAFERDLP